MSRPEQDRITTPFGFATTAAEVLDGVDLHGRRALVTGGASGIGVATARALAAAGADVTIAVRDVAAGERVAGEISASLAGAGRAGPGGAGAGGAGAGGAGAGGVHVAPLDLTDRASIDALVTGWSGQLHMLVCNAGVMATPETRTPEGWELQLATNHLGHFALARGLRAALAGGAAEHGGPSRIVSVSSSAHLVSPVVFDDLHFRFRPYDPGLAYGQAKSANVLLAVGVASRWRDDGIVANALMPGAIATRLQRHSGGMTTAPELVKNAAQGAATSVLLAASPLVEGVSGRYFADCAEARVVDHRPASEADGLVSVAPYVLDTGNAERLWEVSEQALAG
jgi:NAD(P)-dependent dehydrogenase (short-subunit alcohol dehydrogenase family)